MTLENNLGERNLKMKIVDIDREYYNEEDIKKWLQDAESSLNPEDIYDWDEKQWAVFAHYNFDNSLIEDINDLDIDTDTVHINGEDIYVLTDSEADDLADEMLDSYIDECILDQIPERYRYYFDSEKFKSDVIRYDGRESQLSAYDGSENFYTVNDTDYYIYRWN